MNAETETTVGNITISQWIRDFSRSYRRAGREIVFDAARFRDFQKRMKPHKEEWLPVLLDCMKGEITAKTFNGERNEFVDAPDGYARAKAVFLMRTLEEEAAPAIDSIRKLLLEGNKETRHAVAGSVLRIGSVSTNLFDIAIANIESEDENRQLEGILLCEAIGPFDKRAVDAICQIAKREGKLRTNALCALSILHDSSDAARLAFETILGDQPGIQCEKEWRKWYREKRLLKLWLEDVRKNPLNQPMSPNKEIAATKALE